MLTIDHTAVFPAIDMCIHELKDLRLALATEHLQGGGPNNLAQFLYVLNLSNIN